MAADRRGPSAEQHRPLLAKAGMERVERRTLWRDCMVPRQAIASQTIKSLNLLSNYWGMV